MPARPRGGLGRGLEALIPQGVEPAGPDLVPLDVIQANPYQPRSSMDAEQLRSLASSIHEHGVLQPLLVQQDNDRYRLIAGHRRLEAARLAGLDRVPVVVRAADPDDNSLLLALVENVQRADLSPLDEAGAYRELGRRFGLSTEEIAAKTGRSRSAVANCVRLLDLYPEVKELLGNGSITEGHARALLPLRDRGQQLQAANQVVDRGLNVRQTETLVKSLLGRTNPKPPRRTDPDFERMEERFRERLGTKVSLSGSPSGGRITIHYYSEEELNGLYETIIGDR